MLKNNRPRKRLFTRASCRLPLTVGLLMLVVAIILYFLSNMAFKMEASASWLVAECSFDGFLGYAGTCMAAIATATLASVSVWQTQQMREEQSRYERTNAKRPFFVIEAVQHDGKTIHATATNGAFEVYASEENPQVVIILKNVGDGPANNYLWEIEGFGELCDEGAELSCVPADCEKRHSVHIALLERDWEKVRRLEYQNILGCRYRQDLRIRCCPVARDGEGFIEEETPAGIIRIPEPGDPYYCVTIYPLGAQEELP